MKNRNKRKNKNTPPAVNTEKATPVVDYECLFVKDSPITARTGKMI